jgi:hypothetical protein
MDRMDSAVAPPALGGYGPALPVTAVTPPRFPKLSGPLPPQEHLWLARKA